MIALFVVSIILELWLAGCKKEAATGKVPVAVMLKDAPAHCEHVRLRVSAIMLHSDVDGWVTIPFNDSLIDILQFSDTSILIGTVNMPFGTIDSAKLVLGNNNSITIAGTDFPLVLPDEDHDGIVIALNEHITPGHHHFKLVIDFDALASIIEDGGGHYHIHGVCHHSFEHDD